MGAWLTPLSTGAAGPGIGCLVITGLKGRYEVITPVAYALMLNIRFTGAVLRGAPETIRWGEPAIGRRLARVSAAASVQTSVLEIAGMAGLKRVQRSGEAPVDVGAKPLLGLSRCAQLVGGELSVDQLHAS